MIFQKEMELLAAVLGKATDTMEKESCLFEAQQVNVKICEAIHWLKQADDLIRIRKHKPSGIIAVTPRGANENQKEN